LVEELRAGRIIILLTATNIFETQKISQSITLSGRLRLAAVEFGFESAKPTIRLSE
jgi:hypothetical protein